MLDIQDKLKQANARVKALNSNRETLIGDARVEEQKLKQTYESLKELGVSSPESMTLEELKSLEKKSFEKLERLLLSVEEHLNKGEDLILKYQEIKEKQ